MSAKLKSSLKLKKNKQMIAYEVVKIACKRERVILVDSLAGMPDTMSSGSGVPNDLVHNIAVEPWNLELHAILGQYCRVKISQVEK